MGIVVLYNQLHTPAGHELKRIPAP
jgi:hypothetical protein